MKKLSLLLVAFAACAVPAFGQLSFSLTLEAGSLTGAGNTPMVAANDPLLLLVDVGSSTSLPTVTAGSLSSGAAGGIVLAEAAFNDDAFGNQETLNFFSNISTTASVHAGDNIALEWFPTISYTGGSPESYSGSAAVTSLSGDSGDAYGAINPTGQGASTYSGQAWTVPSSGAVSLYYYTVSDSGNEANPTGYASDTIQAAAAPEPATYLLLLFALPLLAWGYRRQAKLATLLARG